MNFMSIVLAVYLALFLVFLILYSWGWPFRYEFCFIPVNTLGLTLPFIIIITLIQWFKNRGQKKTTLEKAMRITSLGLIILIVAFFAWLSNFSGVSGAFYVFEKQTINGEYYISVDSTTGGENKTLMKIPKKFYDTTKLDTWYSYESWSNKLNSEKQTVIKMDELD